MNVSLPTKEQISQLVREKEVPTVSLYMPTHRTGRETRQDPIRLKNLITEAESQLEALGHDQQVRDDLLAPVREIPSDVTDPFWRNGQDGLAFFLQPGKSWGHKLPLDLPELAFASDRAYVNPLLQYFQGEGRFLLLAVSQNRVRLFNGTKHSLAELELEVLPDNLRDALNIDEYQSSLQFHSHTSGKEPNGAALFHGHGAGEGEDRKEEILQYFLHLDRALTPLLNQEKVPLAFAGVEYLFPLFQQACHYKCLIDQPLAGNPDEERRRTTPRGLGAVGAAFLKGSRRCSGAVRPSLLSRQLATGGPRADRCGATKGASRRCCSWRGSPPGTTFRRDAAGPQQAGPQAGPDARRLLAGRRAQRSARGATCTCWKKGRCPPLRRRPPSSAIKGLGQSNRRSGTICSFGDFLAA